jgi:hypothetical protein
MYKDYKITEDIICKENNESYLDDILSQFLKQQEDYGNNVSKEQYENIQKLTKILFCKHKEKLPVIVPIPMGQGKSSLLIEFIKYMYWNDKTFGAIIVKKTIEECEDLCIDVGVNKHDVLSIAPREDLKSHYYKENGRNEDEFIVKTVRGFNFNECSKLDRGSIKRNNEIDYDFRQCSMCENNSSCRVFLSKFYAEKHRFITITHQRLFLSNDSSEIMQDLLYFKGEDGEKIKRKLIIIDEKIDTVDIRKINIKEFYNLKVLVDSLGQDKHRKLFNSIDNYLSSDLKYPKSCTDNVIKQNKAFDENFKFDDELIKLVFTNAEKVDMFISLMNLQKVLGTENITTNIDFATHLRQINYYRYIDVKDYCSEFEKSVILDATANAEVDYFYSGKIIAKDISQQKYKLNLNYCNVNMSKSNIRNNYENITNNIVDELATIYSALNDKILVVCYKEIKGLKDGNLKNKLNQGLIDKGIDNSRIEIIHHGEYTTGTNKFNQYNNIVIIGTMNKGKQYYQNKSLVLEVVDAEAIASKSKEVDKVTQRVADKEFLIDAIQQIGRSALRKNEIVNVYMFNNFPNFMNELTDSFNTKLIEYKPKYLVVKENSYKRIKNLILQCCQNVGERINKKKIKETLSIGDSTYKKAITDNDYNDDFQNFKIENNILEGTRYFIKV